MLLQVHTMRLSMPASLILDCEYQSKGTRLARIADRFSIQPARRVAKRARRKRERTDLCGYAGRVEQLNAVEIEQAITHLAEQPFDPADFPFAFLEAFGNKETTIKRLRAGASNKSDPGGVLQTSNIHIRMCETGEVPEALKALKDSPATAKAKAKFILATDGIGLEAEDLASGDHPSPARTRTFPTISDSSCPLRASLPSGKSPKIRLTSARPAASTGFTSNF